MSATDNWLREIDQGKYVGALLVDLSKAFDSVSHQILLLELSKIGCGTKTGLFFKNYLENRYQRVKSKETET